MEISSIFSVKNGNNFSEKNNIYLKNTLLSKKKFPAAAIHDLWIRSWLDLFAFCVTLPFRLQSCLIHHDLLQQISSGTLLSACLFIYLFALPFFLSLTYRSIVGVDGYRCACSHTWTHNHSTGPPGRGIVRPVLENSTWKHTNFTWGRRPVPRRDSNPQSQHASGRRPNS